MSHGIDLTYEIPYWLKPAMRWKNHQIDDFTLRISATNTAKHFYLGDSLFMSAPFRVVSGRGKVRQTVTETYDGPLHCTEVVIRDGVVEWRGQNFRPTSNINIVSADRLRLSDSTLGSFSFYDRGPTYWPWYDFCIAEDWEKVTGKHVPDRETETAVLRRIFRNLPYAHRGYVFKDKDLQKFFESRWWYMPNPYLPLSTEGFTKTDWQVINVYAKEHEGATFK